MTDSPTSHVFAAALAALILISSAPIGLAHEGGDSREDPEGDFAKKPVWDPQERPEIEPMYAGASCPLTDIVSVEASAVHASTSSLPWNATVVEIEFADLSADHDACPTYGEGTRPAFYYQFRVRPADNTLAKISWGFQGGLDGWTWAYVTWFDDDNRYGDWCSACAMSLERENNTLTLALPTWAGEPPYRHANVVAMGQPCAPVPVEHPVWLVTGCVGTTQDDKVQGYADIVPNLGEGEWSLFTDEQREPVDRLLN